MNSSDLALIALWLLPVWLLGWAAWPLARRVFSFLPDSGLAAGRLLFLLAATLVGYWTASLRILPLGVSVVALGILALVGAASWFGTRGIPARIEARERWRALLVSDLVFLLSFGFFLWVRLRNPVMDLEKPMDALLLGSGAVAQYLPFENKWFPGALFTNYYYFGHLVGATLMRAFGTPTFLAYNLVQPLFCAFFLSIAWSLGAALTRSVGLGVVAMLMVGVGGHLEPLRQLREGATIGTLDWWKTSRVITDPYTINEYPAFTMLIGDLHAHFVALSLTALHFAVCLGILVTDAPRRRGILVALGGLLLGVLAITNTWDAPLYGVLWLGCILWRRKEEWRDTATANDTRLLRATLGGLALTLAAALPYFLRFKSQVSGLAFDPFLPIPFEFGLFWGAWIGLGILAFGWNAEKIESTREGTFRRLLLLVAIVALVVPHLVYIRGFFGDGPNRHQDTIFKFYQQAWLLGGFAVAGEALFRLQQWWPRAPRLKWAILVPAAALAGILALAPLSVVRARAFDFSPGGLSLDARDYLPDADQKALGWLARNAKPSEVVMEGVKIGGGENRAREVLGHYDALYGRVAALTARPSTLGWPQHVAFWGVDWNQAQQRGLQIADFYTAPSPHAPILEELNVHFIFWGSSEQILAPSPPNLPFPAREFRGTDGSFAVVYERN